MIAITSIAPSHANGIIQNIAVDSWLKLGLEVYSMNSQSECELLQPHYPKVTFIPTTRTMEANYKKPYIGMNAIIDWAKENAECVFIINSDIELLDTDNRLPSLFLNAEKGLILLNRSDYDGEVSNAKHYDLGFDGFILHKNFYQTVPQTILCLGQCHWDYQLPFTFLANRLPIYRIRKNILFHKAHQTQYNHDEWVATGRHFRLVNKLERNYQEDPRSIGRMSMTTHRRIINYAQWI